MTVSIREINRPLSLVTLRQPRSVPHVTAPVGIGSVIRESFGIKYMCDLRTSGHIW